MEQNKNLNEKMELEDHSENEEKLYQAKDGSLLFIAIFVLYAFISYITWDKWKTLLDPAIGLIIISCYFRLAKKKPLNKRKFNERTRQMALFAICFAIFINVLPFILLFWGFNILRG